MTRRLIPLDDPEFQDQFRSYRYSAYRLETLQSYGDSGEDEYIAAFMEGRELPRDADDDDWRAMIRANTAAGRIMTVVHVVTEPLTTYVQLELTWGYGMNGAAGQRIFIVSVPEGKAWPVELPEREDYWLFDSRDLYAMHYDTDNNYLGAEPVTEPNRIVRACHLRDAALHLATPWAEYMATKPELARHRWVPLETP